MSFRLLPVAIALTLAGCVAEPPPQPQVRYAPPPPPPPPQVRYVPPPPPAPGPDLAARLAADQERINEGLRAGQLTRREAGELQARHDALEGSRRQLLAQGGGRFLPGQYDQLLAREDALSRTIFAYRHNGATPYAH